MTPTGLYKSLCGLLALIALTAFACLRIDEIRNDRVVTYEAEDFRR